MAKRPRAYYRPQTLSDALDRLKEPDTVPLAGGTKLLAGDISSAVVDLQDLGLDTIEVLGNELRVGSMVRLAALAEFLAESDDDEVPAAFLAEAIHRAGPNTYRNAATLGGSVASRIQDSELTAALLVLEAQVQTADGESFSLTAYWGTAAPALITELRVPWMRGRGAIERVARTPADTPIVSVVLWQPVDGDPRLGATGIDTLPVRLTEAEAALGQLEPGDDLAAVEAAAKVACRHQGDFRGSATYRRDMVGVLVRRAAAVAGAG